MKNNITEMKSRSGSAILITMLLTFVMSIMVAGAILLVEHEHKFSVQSSARAQTLHTAEAGVDFAIATLQQMVQYGYEWVDNGWVKDGDVMSMNDIELTPTGHSAPDSIFSVSINTNTMITTASGRMDEPGSVSGIVSRTIQVELEPDWMYRFEKGLLGRDELSFSGTPNADSFNSNDGPYGGLNVSTNCDIGSMSLTLDGIAGVGTPTVAGDVYVTEVGDAIGDFWTGEEYGTLDVDLPPYNPKKTNMTDVAYTGGEIITVPTIDPHPDGGSYVGVPSISPGGGNKWMTVTGSGKVTIYVAGDVDFGTPDDFNIVPNPPGSSLQVIFEVNGDLALNGTLNFAGPANNLQIFGTENCTSMDITANTDKWMAVYAPNADVTLAGTAAVYGSIVGKTLAVSGTFDFHYDEALATNDVPILVGFTIKSWVEL